VNKRLGIGSILLFCVAAAAFAQAAKIMSAQEFFATVRTHYAGIKSYEATITIKQDTTVSSGRLSYKAPDKLNIRFDSPAGQVLNFDGKKLDVSLPPQKVYLEQEYKTLPEDQLAGVASSEALSVLKNQYSVAYLTGPGTVPLDKDTNEPVTKLKLVASASTSFSDMIMSIKDLVIRRVEATLTNGAQIVVDFTNVRPNVAVPDARFAFVPPGDYEIVKDWLFDPTK
jgi:outer membrane lipoprotein-sorting protein